MYKLRMEKEKAANGVLECDTPEKLFKHFQAAFYIHSGPQDILDGVERMEMAMEILSKPRPSALDLYAAQQACVLSGYDVQMAYKEIHPDSPVPPMTDVVLPERLKADLVSMGVKTFNKCSDQLEEATHKHENVVRINSFIDGEVREKRKFINQKVEEERQSVESIALQKRLEDVCMEIRNMSIVSGKYSFMSQNEINKEYIRLDRERESINGEIRKYNNTSLIKIGDTAASIFDESINKLNLELNKAVQRRDEADAALFEAVSSDILSSSVVSEKQATKWVESNVFISEAGAKNLRRIGYSQEQFKKDVAEMYRYVGGKIGPIEFVVEGKSTRAFARGKSTIALQGNFTKKNFFTSYHTLLSTLTRLFA